MMRPARCEICLGPIKEGLDRITCNCGRSFHETCASKVGECPSCGRPLENL